MVVLVRVAAAGRRLIYTFAPFSGRAAFSHGRRENAARPTAAGKCLPTLICFVADIVVSPFPASAGSKGITH